MSQATREFKVSRQEAADRLGVHPETIRRWVASGKLHAEKSMNGQLWFNTDDVERLRLRVNGVVEVAES